MRSPSGSPGDGPGPAGDPGGRRPLLAALAGVVLLALLVHGRCLANGWAFDDYRFIVDNPAVATPSDPLRFFADPATADPDRTADIYRPLRTWNFAVDRALFGLRPFAFHLESLLLHALNAALVLLLLRRLAGSLPVAAAGAALFAAHPAQVEAVAWVSSRADLLAALFTLLGLLAWVRCRGWDRAYAAALGCGALAALSKEAAVVYPGYLLLLDLLRAEGSPLDAVRRRWRLHLPILLLAGTFAFLVKGMLERSRGLPVGHLLDWWGGSWSANLGTAARAGAYQVLFTLWPARPSLDWYLPLSASPLEPGALASLGLLLGLLAGGAWALLRGSGGARLAGFGVLLALLGGLMTSHLLFPVGIPTAERFLYLPLAGAGIVAAVLFRRLAAGGWLRAAAPFAAAVAALGTIAAVRGGAWRDEDTLWREGPSGAFSPRALRERLSVRSNALGEALDEAARLEARGEGERARALLQETRAGLEEVLARLEELDGFWMRTIEYRLEWAFEARVQRNLSTARLRLGDPEGALRAAREARALDPEHPRSGVALALALHRLGRSWEAGRYLEEALRPSAEGKEPGAVPPEAGAAVLNAAAAERVRRGLVGAAVRAYRASARLLPDPGRNPAAALAGTLEREVEAAANAVRQRAAANPGEFGALAARVTVEGLGRGDPEAARRAFGEAFPGAPDAPGLRTLWALATMEADDTLAGWEAAEAYHRETLRRFPGDAGARLGLARCRAALGDPDGARRLLREVLEDPAAGEDARTEAEDALERL